MKYSASPVYYRGLGSVNKTKIDSSVPSNQSPKMVRASVSAKFCLLWQICLNCSCLSPIVPGALISRLLILNTHFTSKATSNPQQVSGALKIIETREKGDATSLWKAHFLICYQLGPIITRDGCNKGAKRLFHRHCCSAGNSADKEELWWGEKKPALNKRAITVQPNKVTVIINCCQSQWKSN